MDTIIHKAVLIGDSAVGKTSIVNQYIFNSCSPEHQATIGINFFTKILTEGNTNIKLQIWDTAGQEKFHSLIPSYIRNSTVAILVYDITSRISFENLQKWHQIVINSSNPACIVVGNKLDLESERQIAYEEGQKFASQIKASFIETSARTPSNIQELFSQVAAIPIAAQNEEVKKPGAKEEDQTIVVTIDVPNQNQNENKKGCSC
ncbi:Ras family protein [Tritrichomonas foetus]|uniref:Ras family protein n=1 Tax=Tritrichomonas foetus TaxID=1144522 RepID=A0A1J4JGN6_9EUKA|nr:Ras family protein [Tritrichomonas foetus]|eukprot:OHS96372.1 Ras family protein [Tritrichomonas foetus]